jgi:hypothetical protein
MFNVPTHVFILSSTNLKVRNYMHQHLKRYGVTITKLTHFSLQYRLKVTESFMMYLKLNYIYMSLELKQL